MEIYTNNTNRTVKLETPIAPIDGTVDISLSTGGEELYTINTVAYDGAVLSFNMPLHMTHSDRTVEVKWVFKYEENDEFFEFSQTTEVEVVTPILPLREVRAILGEDFEDDSARLIERSVRQIIQAHTGQFFGRYVGSKSITGNDQAHLRLPMRLITLNSVNNNSYLNSGLALRGSGWFLESKTYGVPTIREDLDGWNEAHSGHVPIIAPRHRPHFNFLRNVEYVVDGIWGWSSVPAQVQEAARLLINDYACGDSMYRDRFLSSITSADWRLQFHDGAFSNTGNVRANQLLAEFVLRRGWVVI